MPPSQTIFSYLVYIGGLSSTRATEIDTSREDLRPETLQASPVCVVISVAIRAAWFTLEESTSSIRGLENSFVAGLLGALSLSECGVELLEGFELLFAAREGQVIPPAALEHTSKALSEPPVFIKSRASRHDIRPAKVLK